MKAIAPGLCAVCAMIALLATTGTEARAQEASSPAPSPSAQPAASSGSASDAGNAAALQAAAANPIASLVSIPFQYNTNFNYGMYRGTQQVLNVQPVIPTDLGGGHTWISRIVTPLVALPALAPNVGQQIGLGDLNPQFFYVPKTSNVMVGYGPTFLLPTGTSQWVGQGKWGIGPDAVVVITVPKKVVYGMLVNNIWSFAGDPSRANVNQALLQPFYNWTLPKGFTIGLTSTSTANWNAPGANKWTVPFGTTFSQLMKFGEGMGGQVGGGFFWNVVRPQYGATWTARFQVTVLQPAH